MSSIVVAGDTSGSITISAPAVSGSSVLTLPVATDTLVGKATTDTLTNKTISNITSAAATALTLQSAGTTAITVDTSQNVGIGTASPTSRLQIGDATVNTNNGIILGKYNVASEANLPAIRQISAGTGNDLAIAATSTSGAIRFYTGAANSPLDLGSAVNTERMRIDSSGNVLVGGTSAYGTNPKITVVGGVTISSSSSNYRNMYMSGDTNLYFTNGANQGYLSSAGAWTNASDARLKKNIVEIKYGLQSVLNTKPRSYNRVDVAGEYVGFVAQELKEVIPEVVSGDPEVQFGVDYGSLVAVAFKAIQELKAIVDAQAVRIAALES